MNKPKRMNSKEAFGVDNIQILCDCGDSTLVYHKQHKKFGFINVDRTLPEDEESRYYLLPFLDDEVETLANTMLRLHHENKN